MCGGEHGRDAKFVGIRRHHLLVDLVHLLEIADRLIGAPALEFQVGERTQGGGLCHAERLIAAKSAQALSRDVHGAVEVLHALFVLFLLGKNGAHAHVSHGQTVGVFGRAGAEL